MTAHPLELRRAEVHGRSMAYVEAGDGDPIVLLHGNPTSSYLWRNVIPHLEPLGRCIAPDLVGMGASEKIEPSDAGAYRFVEHRRYLDALLEQLGVERHVTFVLHDWGSALGFDWANRHREAVAGLAYMEALVRPLTWEEWPEASRPIFEAMRSPAGEEICLEKNVFVERILPASVMRDLADEEMEAYRAPFREPGEARRPTLTWPRELPIDGEPADVHEIVEDYARWLAESDVPKLYVRAEPGFLTGVSDPFCQGWSNQTEVTVRGIHFIQEDAPDEIGGAIADWIAAR